MSDIENQLESVSFQLHGLREEYSHEGVTSCIKELENIKKRLQQASLNECYEDQQHQLIEYYERRYEEAKQAIISLERELEEAKQNSNDFRDGNAGEVLIERTNFANNENHSLDIHSKHVLQKELESFKLMENELVEMEAKIHNKERENQEYKEQIKQLEASNKSYNEQVDLLMRQEEELTYKMEEYENKISKLNTENKSMGKETWILKEENELLNSKVNLLEKEEEQIQKEYATLEAKLKAIEKENAHLQSQIKELHEENIVLKEENANISQEFKTVFKDLKHQVSHQRAESLKIQTYKPVKHFYIKSEQNLSTELEGLKTSEREIDSGNLKSTKNTEGDVTAKADQETPMTFYEEENNTPNELQGIEHFNGSLSDFGRRSLQELPHNSSFHEEKSEKRNSIFFVDKSLFYKNQEKQTVEEEYKDLKKRQDCIANCNIF